MYIQNLAEFCPSILKILSKNQFLISIKGRVSIANLRKMTIYNTNLDLVHYNVYTKFSWILSIHSRDIEQKKQFLTSIKGCNSVANLWKMTLYNTNIDLVNDKVYTKFGRTLSIHSQDIEQKPISDINQGPKLCCKFAKKMTLYNSNIDLVNNNVHTKFG